MVTGESRPVQKAHGDQVIGGSSNTTGTAACARNQDRCRLRACPDRQACPESPEFQRAAATPSAEPRSGFAGRPPRRCRDVPGLYFLARNVITHRDVLDSPPGGNHGRHRASALTRCAVQELDCAGISSPDRHRGQSISTVAATSGSDLAQACANAQGGTTL